MDGLEEVYERIDSFRPHIIDMQRELTSRPALSPQNGGLVSMRRLTTSKNRPYFFNPIVSTKLIHLMKTRPKATGPIWLLSGREVRRPELPGC